MTVSGSVLEFTTEGLRGPVPGVRLRVRWGNSDGPKGDLPDAITDASGNYSIPDVSTDVMLFLATAPGSEYRSLCTAWPVQVQGPPPPITALPVVHNSWSGSQPPRDTWAMYGTTYGVVSERVDGRLQPLGGATVGGPGMSVETTNAAGFYVSCTAWGWGDTTLTVQKPGYSQASRVISLGFGSSVDFELTRSLDAAK